MFYGSKTSSMNHFTFREDIISSMNHFMFREDKTYLWHTFVGGPTHPLVIQTMGGRWGCGGFGGRPITFVTTFPGEMDPCERWGTVNDRTRLVLTYDSRVEAGTHLREKIENFENILVENVHLRYKNWFRENTNSMWNLEIIAVLAICATTFDRL